MREVFLYYLKATSVFCRVLFKHTLRTTDFEFFRSSFIITLWSLVLELGFRSLQKRELHWTVWSLLRRQVAAAAAAGNPHFKSTMYTNRSPQLQVALSTRGSVRRTMGSNVHCWATMQTTRRNAIRFTWPSLSMCFSRGKGRTREWKEGETDSHTRQTPRWKIEMQTNT